MTRTESADIVIVGAGVSGLSTARALVELGVRDVLVLDRATVGSGGTGKSSGIVRCHYGIRSLAAMAWHALPILEGAAEILGAESGYRKTGYLVGVGPQNIGSLRANVAMHRSIGIDVELVGPDSGAGDVADGRSARLRGVRLRASGRLRRRTSDGAGLRRRGPTGRRAAAPEQRRGRHWRRGRDRVTGVRLHSGERIAAGAGRPGRRTVVGAAGRSGRDRPPHPCPARPDPPG